MCNREPYCVARIICIPSYTQLSVPSEVIQYPIQTNEKRAGMLSRWREEEKQTSMRGTQSNQLPASFIYKTLWIVLCSHYNVHAQIFIGS